MIRGRRPSRVRILDRQEDKLERAFGNLASMTEDELRAHVRKVRADRRIGKVKASTKKAIRASAEKARDKARELLRNTDDRELLKKLLGGT